MSEWDIDLAALLTGNPLPMVLGGGILLLLVVIFLSELIQTISYKRASRHHSAEAYQQLADRQAFHAIVQENFDDNDKQ
ncbi:hypothetical protein ITJ57_19075 [Plantibacter sp. VKM Ac-2880]|uniref:hypothetical protein n=1 Tax=Plantibacter sp. VKM Ac-2880 TaxID=2783827 RepID=UPI0018905BD1|nr:hypothetical protein [Plantibacter sp. VKM Ac-2880]MBF4570876.1 hypothetical protein [Plantibacter sp. VKM Ac-2880]